MKTYYHRVETDKYNATYAVSLDKIDQGVLYFTSAQIYPHVQYGQCYKSFDINKKFNINDSTLEYHINTHRTRYYNISFIDYIIENEALSIDCDEIIKHLQTDITEIDNYISSLRRKDISSNYNPSFTETISDCIDMSLCDVVTNDKYKVSFCYKKIFTNQGANLEIHDISITHKERFFCVTDIKFHDVELYEEPHNITIVKRILCDFLSFNEYFKRLYNLPILDIIKDC